jgi:glycosyltransferase involved in cell wall biosynthesis
LLFSVRVLQMLSSTGFHGAETMAAELVRQLHGLGVTVDVAVFDNAGRGDRTILEAAAPYIHEGQVIPCRGRVDKSTVATLRKYIAQHRLDLIHSHKFKGTLYSLLARWRIPCGVVVTYHNWLTDTAALRLYAALDKRSARYCDAAVGVSDPVVQELRRHVPANRVHKIGNGVDIQTYRRLLPRAEAKRELDLPPDSILIGFVGRLSAQKGISNLLHAIAELPLTLRTALHFVIAGDGEERGALNDEARMLGLSDRTHFLGTRNDTPTIYSALDIFVLPSEQEAFPMVVLEAMACGLPIIATDVGDTARIIENRVSGLVVPPRDVDSLRQALSELIQEPDRARRFGEVGRERVVKHFSSTQMAQKYLALYEDLLRSPRHG